MCLTRLKDISVKTNHNGLIVAYKVVKISRGKMSPIHMSMSKSFRKGWNRDKYNVELYANDGRIYPSGFHLYLNKSHAFRYSLGWERIWTVVKCLVNPKDVIVTGMQDYLSGKKSFFPSVIVTKSFWLGEEVLK